MITLIIGGARSGKSAFAEKYCLEKSFKPAYVATAQVLDSEMEDRVRKHKNRRKDLWKDYEEAYEVSNLLENLFKEHSLVLMDCLTVYITNLMLKNFHEDEISDLEGFMEKKEEEILEEMERILRIVPTDKELVIVSNEVGFGIVPENFLSRAFRDISGRMNQLIGQEGDQVIMVCAGLPIKIKPSLERI